MSVSVILPTFRRPDGLRAALASLMAQSRQPDEIIVVDNDPDGSARTGVANAKAVARCAVVYVHAERPGVANARNAGWAAATGRHVAFLDDDEIASAGWLEALLASAGKLGASVVFGPLRGEALDAATGLRGSLAQRLYSRPGNPEDEILDGPYGCGNSLVDRQAFDLSDAPFDPRMNACGGEDDLFFAELARQGAVFGWSARAHAVETVDARRTSWRYLLARSFAFGQGATQAAANAKPRRLAGIAFWMAVGLGQMFVFGTAAIVTSLIGSSSAAGWLDRAVQGAGKLFWVEAFEPRFYGEAAPAD
ncbi:glycosyl transferase, family 2 [Maricaulis maris MCS10]|uniref:Glycosyl transferase, family 2 n=1 Tax=Maricaulis maris (strain MCS10) TaxID=394221 RepID=Q0AP08_MARMM|nr:glycosyltransferase family 2 protein [Maricaulis maris]ABI65979.1 glycosyl transferase, family 2 [Maricaulis maris MCS10]